MGADISHRKVQALNRHAKGRHLLEDAAALTGWKCLLSSISLKIPSALCQLGPFRNTRRMIKDKCSQPPVHLWASPSSEAIFLDLPLSHFITVFLPEFPHRSLPRQECFQVLGCIAKGYYGPILKVMDLQKEKTCALKVLPKSEILKQGVVEQSKEEVIIQRQVRHPFLHNLLDCWQTQQHLFIMCEYCNMGDLYTYWTIVGHFGEDCVRVFAAELGLALGFLHDIGIIHRDVKMENILLNDKGHLRLTDFGLSRRLQRGCRAFTICGTMQYMAPEVLSGGPYNHSADWWSLGILLFSLATGKFPVPPEPDHSSMLQMVRKSKYDMPKTFSSQLSLLLNELLCKNPSHRLHNLHRLKQQPFFRAMSFDVELLQKVPMDFIMELKNKQGLTDQRQLLDRFQNFDLDLHLADLPQP